MQNKRNETRPSSEGLTTKEYAARKLVKEQTVRKRYCQKGSYFGAVPVKLCNGRLAWPGDE